MGYDYIDSQYRMVIRSVDVQILSLGGLCWFFEKVGSACLFTLSHVVGFN